MRCTARTKQGDSCRRWAVEGTERCPKHPEKSLVQIQRTLESNVTHGLYAKALRAQPDMLERVARLRVDPLLLDLTEDIAYARALLERYIEGQRQKNLTAEHVEDHYRLLDHLGRQLERHHRIEYDKANLVTERALLAYSIAISRGLGELMLEYCDKDRVDEAMAATRDFIVRMGAQKDLYGVQ